MSHSTSLLRRVPPAVWVFLGSFLIQFLILNGIANSRHFLPDGDDMKFYNDWAQKLMGTLPWRPGEPNYPGTAFYGLPGYAYGLAAIYTSTGGYDHWFSPFLVGQLQALFHAGTATFLFLLGRRVFTDGKGDLSRRGTWIGLAAAAVWVAFTPAQVFSAILMPTSWVVCAFWGTTYWLVCIHQRKTSRWWSPWLWMGLAAGAMAMIVATILMLIPLMIIGIALTVGRRESFLKRASLVVASVATLLGGVYAGCSPAWIHNYFIAKDPVLLSGHDGLNFYLGNHATATGYTKIPAGLRASQEGLLRDSLSIPERELGRPLKKAEVSAYWKEKGRAYIRENPGPWMKLLGVKFANFWNAYQYDDLSILKLMRDEGAVPPGFRFGWVAAFGLPGLLLCFWRWPSSRWVVGAVLLHILALMPVFITERYRLAAVPGLILLGCGGVAIFWRALVDARWAVVMVYLATVGGSVWFTTRGTVDVAMWSLDFYKAGIRGTDGAVEAMSRTKYSAMKRDEAKKAGNAALADEHEAERRRQENLVPVYLANAQRNLETAFRYSSTNDEVNFALGNVWFHRRDFDRAKVCYEGALRYSIGKRPHDRALNNLALIAIERKQWLEAQKYLQGSLEIEPEDADRWFLLARVLHESGNSLGAENALDRAEKLSPGAPQFEALRKQWKQPIPTPQPPAPGPQ